jgi:hypothetical protein
MRDCHTLTDGEVIAIDGRTVRGSYDKSRDQQVIQGIRMNIVDI